MTSSVVRARRGTSRHVRNHFCPLSRQRREMGGVESGSKRCVYEERNEREVRELEWRDAAEHAVTNVPVVLVWHPRVMMIVVRVVGAADPSRSGEGSTRTRITQAQ